MNYTDDEIPETEEITLFAGENTAVEEWGRLKGLEVKLELCVTPRTNGEPQRCRLGFEDAVSRKPERCILCGKLNFLPMAVWCELLLFGVALCCASISDSSNRLHEDP